MVYKIARKAAAADMGSHSECRAGSGRVRHQQGESHYTRGNIKFMPTMCETPSRNFLHKIPTNYSISGDATVVKEKDQCR